MTSGSEQTHCPKACAFCFATIRATVGTGIHCRQGYFGRSWNNVVPLGPLRPMTYPEAFAHPELAELPDQFSDIVDPRSVVAVGANVVLHPDCCQVDCGIWAGIRRICDHKFGLNAAWILTQMNWLLYRIKGQLYLEFTQHNVGSATVL
jgi:hypothetical protein